MIQTGTLVLQQIPLLKQTLLYLKLTSVAQYLPFFKTIRYVTALKFFHVWARVTIAMWQLTILSILNSISAQSFLVCSCCSSSYFCDFSQIGYFCSNNSSVLVLYLGNCIVGCHCGQPWIFWLVYRVLKFSRFSLSWSVVCPRFEYLQFIMPSLDPVEGVF